MPGGLDMTSPNDEYRDLWVAIHCKGYEKAVLYTNLIMVGGYAGAFAIWNITSDTLSKSANAWVGLLLVISLSVFVFFEIYKMIYFSRHELDLSSILAKNLPRDAFVKEVERRDKAMELERTWVMLPVWVASLSISVLTALAAGAILICSFVSVICSAS